MVSITSPHFTLLQDTNDPAQKWLKSLQSRYSESVIQKIEQAISIAKQFYADHKIITEKNVFDHALGTAGILADMRFDALTVISAILHDLPQFLPSYRSFLSESFSDDGKFIAKLVEGVSYMANIRTLFSQNHLHNASSDVKNQQNESLRKMLLAMAEDFRVVLIKLAERTQIIRNLSQLENPDERQKIAQETMDIFAPLANRLGVWQIKWELEDLSFRFLQPDIYKKIASLLDEKRTTREAYINSVMDTLKSHLDKENIKAEVTGRPKHIYSIYNKMRRKNVSFNEVYDVRAVRVLVENQKDCYAILGIVHSLWQQIPKEFDDYISHPKNNYYRSLHTAVIGPDNKALEIQIRTHDMHHHAEFGVAAHWRYKEGGQGDSRYDEKIAWLRQILDWQSDLSQISVDELSEQFRNELFNDTIYVLTPKGEVVDLPKGSTPIDFAYHLHTELGHRCRGAKIDGRIAVLNTALDNGQRVQILASKSGGPNRDWLNANLGFVKTERAKSKIRKYFNELNIQENRILQTTETKITEILTTSPVIAETDADVPPLDKRQIKFNQILGSNKPPKVLINGVGNLMTSLAKCCKPVPPDPIVAYLTRGRGAVIHRSDCENVMNVLEEYQNKLLLASWEDEALTSIVAEHHKTSDNDTYDVDILIEAKDRKGLLNDITHIFSNESVNVIQVNTHSHAKEARMFFTIQVNSIKQLERILNTIRALDSVMFAERNIQQANITKNN